MKGPAFLGKTLLLLSALSLQSSEAYLKSNKERPNIILIFADDLGYGDLGCYGATRVKTPNIDKMAAQGRIFLDAHSASAVCSPSRYGLLTGEYPLRRNFWGPISLTDPLSVDTRQMTLPRLFKEAGYATACIGKWHLGFGEEQPDWNGELKPGPLELGFDYYFGVPQVNSGPPFVYVENHRVVGLDPSDPFVLGKESVTKRYPEKSGYKRIGGGERAHRLYVDELVGTTLKEKTITWLTQQHQKDESQPFLVYLATTNIHHPFTPAARFQGTSQCGLYGDFIHELDWIVGEVLDALDRIDESEETLVILTSDNGGMLNNTGQKAWKAGHRLNGRLLGFKFGSWEGGHRVPMIARWPGKIAAGSRSRHLFSHVDFMATFAGLLDRPLGEGQGRDSLDQLSTLTGDIERSIRETLILQPNSPSHMGVRKGKWVYIPGQDGGGFQGKAVGDHLLGGAAALLLTGQINSDVVDGRIRSDAPSAQLYELDKDPFQTTNVYSQFPEVVERLEAIRQDYERQIEYEHTLGWIFLDQQR